MVTMLKNKCSVWKRIKFPTFWYNCYYFTWSDTYFIQLEPLLINHPSYDIEAVCSHCSSSVWGECACRERRSKSCVVGDCRGNKLSVVSDCCCTFSLFCMFYWCASLIGEVQRCQIAPCDSKRNRTAGAIWWRMYSYTVASAGTPVCCQHNCLAVFVIVTCSGIVYWFVFVCTYVLLRAYIHTYMRSHVYIYRRTHK